jgi:xylulokinase
MRYRASGKWGGASLAAASSYQWFRDTFGALEVEREKQQKGNAFAALNDLAAQAPPGSRGVLFLPYLNSAGTPHWNPHARAAFIGMSVAHGRAELTRSVMEGITLEMHDTMTGWHNNGMALTTLRLGGGPTHSPLWNQIQADVYGRMVQIMCVEESTALGAAILGGIGAGVFDSVQEGVDAMVHVANEIEPNIENHDIYQEMYRAYIEAYEGLNHKAFGTLAAMQVNTSR